MRQGRVGLQVVGPVMAAAGFGTGQRRGSDVFQSFGRLGRQRAIAELMMLPTAAPALLQYARSVPIESEAPRPAFRITAFAGGYVFVWMLFSAAATIVQRVMSQAQLLTPMMEPAMPALAGGLLLGAGDTAG